MDARCRFQHSDRPVRAPSPMHSWTSRYRFRGRKLWVNIHIENGHHEFVINNAWKGLNGQNVFLALLPEMDSTSLCVKVFSGRGSLQRSSQSGQWPTLRMITMSAARAEAGQLVLAVRRAMEHLLRAQDQFKNFCEQRQLSSAISLRPIWCFGAVSAQLDAGLRELVESSRLQAEQAWSQHLNRAALEQGSRRAGSCPSLARLDSSRPDAWEALQLATALAASRSEAARDWEMVGQPGLTEEEACAFEASMKAKAIREEEIEQIQERALAHALSKHQHLFQPRSLRALAACASDWYSVAMEGLLLAEHKRFVQQEYQPSLCQCHRRQFAWILQPGIQRSVRSFFPGQRQPCSPLA